MGKRAIEVVAAEFPRELASVPTRMIEATPHGVYTGELIARHTPAVVVALASSTCSPKVMVPRQIGVTRRSLRPRVRRGREEFMRQVYGLSPGGSRLNAWHCIFAVLR